MFLLNHSPTTPPVEKPRCFTSHYVPIKSATAYVKTINAAIFTSHYVPIKSATAYVKTINAAIFTSHYVPIKSMALYYSTVSGNFLYIPLCSY